MMVFYLKINDGFKVYVAVMDKFLRLLMYEQWSSNGKKNSSGFRVYLFQKRSKMCSVEQKKYKAFAEYYCFIFFCYQKYHLFLIVVTKI